MEKDIGYLKNFLTSFNQMRKEQFICDFTVIIGNLSFPVHRAVLAAASIYFTAMFSSDIKEVREGYVVMQDLDAVGVRQCIEYMYTGCVKPSHESVKYTLKASQYIQLDGLTSICFKFLQRNLSVDTCISKLNISCFHGRDDVSKLAEIFIIEHFETVTLTEMFPLISKSDLVYYIKASEADYQVAWQAVMRWFSVAKEETTTELLEVMKSINAIQFPFKFLLKTVLTEPLVIENKPCQNLVISTLFDNADDAKSNLNTENVFTVKNLTKVQKIPNAKKIKEAVDEYLEDHFEELRNTEGFCQLEEEEIIHLFQSSKTKYSSEKIKWDAALIWVKHDQRHRKKVFMKLFKSLKLEVFSRNFIRETVLIEPLVKDYQTCQNMLLRTLFTQDEVEESKQLDSHIACLDIENGDIKALNVENNQWKDLPSVKLNMIGFSKKRQIVNVLGKIYCLVNENVLELNLKQMKWIPKQPRVERVGSAAEVVSFQQRIYVLDRGFMTYYIPADDAWVEIHTGCGLGSNFCVASSDKFIYAMGGCNDGKAKRFNPDTQSWSTIATMNTGRSSACAAVFQRMVFVVGGVSNDKFTNSVEVYNPIAKVWTDIKSMCVLRRFPSTCVANNRLYVVGGACNVKGELLVPGSIEVYDEDTGEWEIVEENPSVRRYTSCCALSLKAENKDAAE